MQGSTPAGSRTSPSAGATYPIELYVLDTRGVLRYRPATHDLEVVSQQDALSTLHEEAAGQDSVRDAAVVFVIAGVFERTAVKYGERSVRYVHIEVGHVAQNLMLEVTVLGLGTARPVRSTMMPSAVSSACRPTTCRCTSSRSAALPHSRCEPRLPPDRNLADLSV